MSVTRRQFLGSTAASALAFTFVPSRAFGANEKLNIAAVGSGGMGGSNINAVKSQNIVALCDVDDRRAADTYRSFPGVPTFRDFRKMFAYEPSRDRRSRSAWMQ